MKGTSKVIMGATLIMVLSLAIVLSLILVLLAELYCSLLLCRRHHSTTALEGASVSEAPTQSQSQYSSAPPPLSRFYSHGVLNAPRNFLFPSVSSKAENKVQQHSQLSQLLETSQPPQHSCATAVVTAVQVRILSSSPPSPNPATESKLQAGEDANGSRSSKEHEHLVYISNPIFDDCSRYATPDTSPSRLGNTSGSSDEDGDDENQHTCPITVTPPLSPMKELPAEACSVSLKDSRCLNTSGSDSHSINGGGSTSSSATPCTSPSW
ncbi:unnamed protein product [Rhodiola kirilowii]